MIWYDTQTHEPVAPGACEDAGIPSIISYECYNCGFDGPPVFSTTEVDLKVEIITGIGRCASCGVVLLTTV